MKKKIVEKFIYEGLGFPIELHKVEMVMVGKDKKWQPKIDVRKVADTAIEKLAFQKERFSGNQVKFIRSYFSMTLRAFAENIVRESHTAVSKWENFGEKVTNMDINIEKILRLYIYQKVVSIKKKKVKQKVAFYDELLDPKSISSSKRVSCLQVHV